MTSTSGFHEEGSDSEFVVTDALFLAHGLYAHIYGLGRNGLSVDDSCMVSEGSGDGAYGLMPMIHDLALAYVRWADKHIDWEVGIDGMYAYELEAMGPGALFRVASLSDWDSTSDERFIAWTKEMGFPLKEGVVHLNAD